MLVVRGLFFGLFMVMFGIVFVSGDIFADSHDILQISATTNPPSYENGNGLILSGNIQNYDTSDSGQLITFLIISPLNELVTIGSITPNSDGSFEHDMIVGGVLL